MTSTFEPSVVLIENITNEQYATVTFVKNHNFFDNEYISLRVSRDYGMVEINNKRGKVLSHDINNVILDIDTTNYTPFVTPGNIIGTTPPCAVPSSSGVNFNTYVPTMILDDVFDNRPI